MSYAIDIIRLTMLTLGIKPEALLLKTIDDFAGRGISKDVQKLCYNYYSCKLQDVVHQINAYTREEKLEDCKKICQVLKFSFFNTSFDF